MRLFLLALLGASLSAAQSTDAPKNARLEGQVVNSAGLPVKEAAIRLVGLPGQQPQPGANYGQSSDSDGKFVIDGILPGTYLVAVQKTGFSLGTTSNMQFTLTSGQVMKGVIFKMNPLGVITGRITDQDGDPVPNTQVRVMRYLTLGTKQLVNSGTGQSDDQGNFRIFNLEPGRYYISAIPRPAIGPSGTQQPRGESSITTYYPNGVNPTNATSLNLLAGGELRGIDIKLRKGRVYSIRGKAVGTGDATAAANIRINLLSKEDSSLNMSSFQQAAGPAAGTFAFQSLTPGTYTLQVRPVPQPPGGQANAIANSNFIGRVEVTVKDSDLDDVTLPLTPAAPFDIVGNIKLEDGDFKQLNGTLRGLPVVVLRDVESTPTPMLRPEIKEDGTFRLQGVMPSRYMVDFSLFQTGLSLVPSGAPTQGVYVKSVRFAGQEVTGPLDLTSVTEGNLQIVLSGKGAVVSGIIRNSQGNPLPGIRVALWPKSPDPLSFLGGIRPSITDVNGSVRINSLAPGDYYLAAWEDLMPDLLTSPDNLNLFTRDASSVKLGEGANETVELKLISKEKLVAAMAAIP